MKKQTKTHRTEIVYFSGEKKVFEPLTERQAKWIYDTALRDMAIERIKRISYGLII
jgi:hypothetical protein